MKRAQPKTGPLPTLMGPIMDITLNPKFIIILYTLISIIHAQKIQKTLPSFAAQAWLALHLSPVQTLPINQENAITPDHPKISFRTVQRRSEEGSLIHPTIGE